MMENPDRWSVILTQPGQAGTFVLRVAVTTVGAVVEVGGSYRGSS